MWFMIIDIGVEIEWFFMVVDVLCFKVFELLVGVE